MLGGTGNVSESRSAVIVGRDSGFWGMSPRLEVLICAKMAARSSGRERGGVAARLWVAEGRYEVTRTGSLEEREFVRRRPDGMEPNYKRFRIFAIFCS